MGNKIALIISFVFAIFIFLLGSDLIGIEMIYSNLDAISISAGYMISKKGFINDSIVEYVENEGGAIIENLNEKENLKIGDLFKFSIYKYYDSFFVSNEPLKITITRSVIIGQFA